MDASVMKSESRPVAEQANYSRDGCSDVVRLHEILVLEEDLVLATVRHGNYDSCRDTG
jgi:hypothetical protein